MRVYQNTFLRNHYDVIVIGAGLVGRTAASPRFLPAYQRIRINKSSAGQPNVGNRHLWLANPTLIIRSFR
jgi:hypothetical protein